jgi:hypothetical protein
MKKIVLAFDGSNFSEGAFEFARQLNDIEPVLLTGVFVPQVDYASLWSYSAAVGVGAGPAYMPITEQEDEVALAQNIEHFRHLCDINGITYRVHEDFSHFVLNELKRESRFSDLVILSGELFYKGLSEGSQFDYLKDVLRVAECPVIIVPEDYEFPKNNILSYDGTEGSVYAIKQFAYLFPTFASNPTLMVFAEDQRDRDFPAKEYVTELVTQHFKDLTYYKLELDPRKYFTRWIVDRKDSILVSGAFSRSVLSQAFKKSFVANIIKEHKLPVFIAHR